MTDWLAWFQYQLQASADGFEWAFSQIPGPIHANLPPDPDYLGTWPPARHVWHVTEYERCLAIPYMKLWLNGPVPSAGNWQDDDLTWANLPERGPDALISNFRQVRQQQIKLLDQFKTMDWDTPREIYFGRKPLSWLVTKTFQHTYEHADTLLRMGLWWQDILEEQAGKSEEHRE